MRTVLDELHCNDPFVMTWSFFFSLHSLSEQSRPFVSCLLAMKRSMTLVPKPTLFLTPPPQQPNTRKPDHVASNFPVKSPTFVCGYTLLSPTPSWCLNWTVRVANVFYGPVSLYGAVPPMSCFSFKWWSVFFCNAPIKYNPNVLGTYVTEGVAMVGGRVILNPTSRADDLCTQDIQLYIQPGHLKMWNFVSV